MQFKSRIPGLMGSIEIEIKIDISQWFSCPMLGAGKHIVPVINVLIGCYTFLTALHVDQVKIGDFNFDIFKSTTC